MNLTLIPGKVDGDDVDRLRDLGLTDEQITVAAQVISYFNYINRVADGLGADLEDWMTGSYEQWMDQKPKWSNLPIA